MDFSLLFYRELPNLRIFAKWLSDPGAFYNDESLYSKFIRLKDHPLYGSLILEFIVNGISDDEILQFAECGIVVADCFRRDEK